MWVDVGELVRNQVPDAEGGTLPLEATFGSYRIRDEANPVTGRVYPGTLLIDTGPMGHAHPLCNVCCGYVSAAFSPYPGFTCPGCSTPTTVMGNNACDGMEDITSYCYSWSSTNTGVATVDVYGNVTGVAVGTATIECYVSVEGTKPPSCANRIFSPQEPMNVDSFVFSITSGSAPNDTSGVVAKTAFNLRIQAKNASGVVPDTGFVNQDVPFNLVNINTSVGESAPSSVNFSAGTTNAGVTAVEASALTSSVPTITVNAYATGTVFLPYVYMNVLATDEGKVGLTTACGHVIQSNDHFVALPYSKTLCGHNVLVTRATYQETTPVEDVGPWCPNTPGPGNSNTCSCTADSYWLGTAIPKAVTLEGTCNSNGAGIDLADGTYHDLGLSGNAYIDWKFP